MAAAAAAAWGAQPSAAWGCGECGETETPVEPERRGRAAGEWSPKGTRRPVPRGPGEEKREDAAVAAAGRRVAAPRFGP